MLGVVDSRIPIRDNISKLGFWVREKPGRSEVFEILRKPQFFTLTSKRKITLFSGARITTPWPLRLMLTVL